MNDHDKDRHRRYVTPNALARDIQRFLACEPVEACPPSTAYRLKQILCQESYRHSDGLQLRYFAFGERDLKRLASHTSHTF